MVKKQVKSTKVDANKLLKISEFYLQKPGWDLEIIKREIEQSSCLWYKAENKTPKSKSTTDLQNFFRLNTFQTKPVNKKNLIKVVKDGNILDSGLDKSLALDYEGWNFEHINDLAAHIINPTEGPMLRQLYGFHDKKSISEISPSLIGLTTHLSDLNWDVIIVSNQVYVNELKLAETASEIESTQSNVVSESHFALNFKESLLINNSEHINKVTDGAKLIWLHKLRGWLREIYEFVYSKNFNGDNHGFPCTKETLVYLLNRFFAIISTSHPSLLIEFKTQFVKFSPLFENDLKYFVGKLVEFTDRHKKTRSEPQIFTVHPLDLSYFLDCYKVDGKSFATIVDIPSIDFFIYSDASVIENDKLSKPIIPPPSGNLAASFAGVLLTSTQHVVSHWRYMVPSMGNNSTAIECIGILYGLLLAKRLRFPIRIRSDGQSAVHTVRVFLNSEAKAKGSGLSCPEVLKIVQISPELKPLFEELSGVEVVSRCRVDWVKGHSPIPPNILVDYLARLAYTSSDFLDLSQVFEKVRDVKLDLN